MLKDLDAEVNQCQSLRRLEKLECEVEGGNQVKGPPMGRKLAEWIRKSQERNGRREVVISYRVRCLDYVMCVYVHFVHYVRSYRGFSILNCGWIVMLSGSRSCDYVFDFHTGRMVLCRCSIRRRRRVVSRTPRSKKEEKVQSE